MKNRCPALRVGLPAVVGAGLLTFTSAIDSATAYADELSSVSSASNAADALALIMGGTLDPQPAPSYVTAINDVFIQPNPDYTGYSPFGLYTPEGVNIPFISGLTLDQSVAQGQLILNNAILGRPAGSETLVFGYSQSAAIATLEMNALDALPAGERPSPDALSFMLIGDLDNPDGGLFTRFTLHIPILGISSYGPTPPDTPYPTDIYTGQYDGVANFPQYPINILADLNAVAGATFVHPYYADMSATQIQDAVPLATSPGYDGVTHYFMIPTQNLPLLAPLRAIPFVGKPLADLLQPDLTVLINLGYNPNGYADVPTPAQLWPGFSPLADLVHLAQPLLNDLGVYLPTYPAVPPPDFNPVTIVAELIKGAYQGIKDALVDVGVLPAIDAATTYPAVNTVAAVTAVASGAAPVTTAATQALPALAVPPELSQLAATAAADLSFGPLATDLGLGSNWFSPIVDLAGLFGSLLG